ncbi:MAG TPA: hypothetical protein VFZ97_10825 [Acidimicrobiales bacterium]
MRRKAAAAHEDELSSLDERLTRQEDDELRRLNCFSQVGALAAKRQERFVELRLRDRRAEIRPPREFGEDETYVPKQRRRLRLPFTHRSKPGSQTLTG